jgi:alkylhydroperoxidase family enzyme
VASLGNDISDKVVRFETCADFTDRQKAALRLAAAFLEVPSGLSRQARAEALTFFTPAEIVGLLYKLTTFLINKPRAALGIDRPLDPERLTAI